MAKLNFLQLTNRVLRNIGEPATLTTLSSLSTIQQVVVDKLNESIFEIATDQTTRWQFLESLGSIPMTTGNNEYTITALTTGSDLMREDKESFRSADALANIDYKTPQEFDALYPQGITTAREGYPEFFTKYAGKIVFDKVAGATQNGKYINFRYWKIPIQITTATATATCDIPEIFDQTVLCNMATMKVLVYLGSEDAAAYKVQVFGDSGNYEGSYDKMKEIYGSPEITTTVTEVF